MTIVLIHRYTKQNKTWGYYIVLYVIIFTVKAVITTREILSFLKARLSK